MAQTLTLVRRRAVINIQFYAVTPIVCGDGGHRIGCIFLGGFQLIGAVVTISIDGSQRVAVRIPRRCLKRIQVGSGCRQNVIIPFPCGIVLQMENYGRFAGRPRRQQAVGVCGNRQTELRSGVDNQAIAVATIIAVQCVDEVGIGRVHLRGSVHPLGILEAAGDQFLLVCAIHRTFHIIVAACAGVAPVQDDVRTIGKVLFYCD